MRRFCCYWLLIAGLVSLSPSARAQQVVLKTGSIVLPPGFTHQGRQGTDSYMGRITAPDSSLVIQYDIGFSAGARVHPARRSDFMWFLEHEVNGNRSYSGMVVRDGDRRIATTVLGEGSDPMALPANFEASVRGERDVAAFMAIVMTYRPRTRK